MNKYIRYTILSIIILALIGIGLWYFVFREKPIPIGQVNVEQDNSEESGQGEPEPIIIPEWYAYDKDGDGIDDATEDTLGTSKWEADSDFDGLSDDIEINVYDTDPSNPDTDGDGFWDGLEVISGYSPVGEGKLL